MGAQHSMTKFIPLLKAFLLIILVAVILLYTDRKNRFAQPRSVKQQTEYIRRDSLPHATLTPELIEQVRARRNSDWPSSRISLVLIEFSNALFTELSEEGILQGLSEIGLTRGEDYDLEIFNAQGDITILNSIVDVVASKPYDYVLTTSTPTLQAATHKLKNKTIVFCTVANPLLAGAGETFQDHMPNITGVATWSDLEGMIKLVKAFLPGIKRVGTLYCPGEVNSVIYKEAFEQLLKDHGMELVSTPTNTHSEVSSAIIALATSDIQAICQIVDNLIGSSYPQIIKVATEKKLPLFSFESPHVEAGALAAVAKDHFQAGREAMYLLARIIAGEHPANIPFTNVQKTNIVINKEIADYLNIPIPAEYQQYILTQGEITGSDQPPKFILLLYSDSPLSEMVHEGILAGMEASGTFIEAGKILEVKNAFGDVGTLNTLVDGLSMAHYDLIFSVSTPTLQTLAKKISHIPVIFSAVADPVAAGAGKSFTDHQPNITGISTLGAYREMALLLRDLFPDITTVGTLFCPGETNSVNNLSAFRSHASQVNIEVIAVPVNSSSEITDAMLVLDSKKTDVICQIIDNLSAGSFSAIQKQAYQSRIPLFGFISEQVDQGAVIAVARDYGQAGVDAWNLGMRILQGENPADIPFKFVSKTDLILNLKAAEYFDIAIPEHIRKSADRIIN